MLIPTSSELQLRTACADKEGESIPSLDMARPICWECGKQLMYWKGKPVFESYTDPAGNEHKMHKDCFKYGHYGDKPVTAQPDMEYQRATIMNTKAAAR